MIKNKKAEGGLWLLLMIIGVLVLFTPMCAYSGNNVYESCTKDCRDIYFDCAINYSNWTNTKYFQNNTMVSNDYVQEYCYKECKPYFS